MFSNIGLKLVLNFGAVFAILGGKEASKEFYSNIAFINSECTATAINEEYLVSAAHCFQDFNNTSSNIPRLADGTAVFFNPKREYKFKVMDPETIQAKATPIFTDIVYLKADQRMQGVKKLKLGNINEKHYEYGSYEYKFLNLTAVGYGHDGEGYTGNRGFLKQVSSTLLGIDSSIGVFTVSEGGNICAADSGGPLFNQLGEIVAVLNGGFGSCVYGSAATWAPLWGSIGSRSYFNK